MKPWNKRTTIAIEKSIAHWERMIKQAKKFYDCDLADEFDMIEAIGEEWDGKYCDLCKLFDKNICLECPLEITGNGCSKNNSPWTKVVFSDTWGEWLVNAKVMLKTLKALRKGRPA